MRPKAEERDPARPSGSWRLALFVGALAAACQAWVLTLQFQIDDYWLLPSAGRQLADAIRLLLAPEQWWSGELPRLPWPEAPLFQPVVWALLAPLVKLGGVPLDSAVMHTAGMVFHGLAAALLLLRLHAAVGRQAALFGTLLFSVSAAGIQGVSWIASLGIPVVLVLALATWRTLDRLSEASPRRAWLFPGTIAALALGAHNAGVLVPCLALLASARAVRRRPTAALFFLLPSALLFAWRWRYLGTPSLVYGGGTAADWSTIPRMFAALPGLVAWCAAPWRALPPRQTEGAWLPELGVPVFAAVALFLLAVGLGGWMTWKAHRGLALKLAIAAAAFALPALFMWSMGLETSVSDGRFGRAAYLPMAWILALAGAGLGSPTPRLRRVRMALFVALLVIQIDALIHTARLERRVAHDIATRRTLAESAASTGHSLAIIDSAAESSGIPLVLAPLYSRALRPPFVSRGATVRGFFDEAGVLESGWLTRTTGPVQVLTWGDLARQFSSAELPGAPTALTGPLYRSLPPKLPGTLRFGMESPVDPRVHPVLLIEKTPSASPFYFAFETEVGPSHAYPLPGSEAQLTIGLDQVHTWMFGRALREFHTSDVGPIRVQWRNELPAFPAIASPGTGSTYSVRELPTWIISDFPKGRDLELAQVFSMGGASFRILYRAPERDLPRDPGGTVRYVPRLADRVSANHPEIHWEALREYYSGTLVRYSVRRVKLEWRLSAVYPGTDLATTRSDWSTLSLTP